jgi:hypothetical protein
MSVEKRRHLLFTLTAKACVLAVACLVLPLLLVQTLPLALFLLPPLTSMRTVKGTCMLGHCARVENAVL